MTLRLLNVRGRKSPREEDDSRAAGHENPELFKSTPALPPHKYKHFPDQLYTLSCCFFNRPSHSCHNALCLIYSFALPAIEHPLCLLPQPASSTFHSSSHSKLFFYRITHPFEFGGSLHSNTCESSFWLVCAPSKTRGKTVTKLYAVTCGFLLCRIPILLHRTAAILLDIVPFLYIISVGEEPRHTSTNSFYK